MPSSGIRRAMVLSALAFTGSVHALSLDFHPSAQLARAGDTVSLRLVADLKGGESALGAFDVDVRFDPAALVLEGVVSASGVGAALLQDTLVAPGRLDIAGASTESVAALASLQADEPLHLATLNFTVAPTYTGPGTRVRIDASEPFLVFADGLGARLAFDADTFGDATISVPVAVPLAPATATVAILLIALALLQRRRSH